MSYNNTIERILTLLENAGASTVRNWAPKPVIHKVVKYDIATLILSKMDSDPSFVRSFVKQCLPPACRDFSTPLTPFYDVQSILQAYIITKGANFAYIGISSIASKYRTATEGEVQEVVEKAKDMILKYVDVESSIFSAQEASSIFHGCFDEEELTKNRLQELIEIVSPLIYGITPLYRALEEAAKLFSHERYRDHKKLLFVLSDGIPTDQGSTDQLLSRFSDEDVTVVSCYITKSTRVEPLRLFNEAESHWEAGAKLLFDISSTIATQLLPRTIFIKRGWKIDIKNNATKMFLQVNRPDIIKNSCDLAQNVVCCQDALLDILVSVSLDVYINQSTTGFRAQRQQGGTCYANATAAVLHMSMRRILGREDGYPDSNTLRQKLIDCYGEDGADVLKVLQKFCPQYRLRFRRVDIIGAMRAITAKRPVIATFSLTDTEWNVFGEFFEEKRSAVLTKKEIDILKRQRGDEIRGHAVVLTSYNSNCLFLMNSWGEDWGDTGFFRVKNADVLGLELFDVFWTSDDLSNSEKAYYKEHGAEVAATITKRLTGLQVAKYPCPLCNKTSLVTQFTGRLSQAKCPECKGEFRSDGAGNILAMNIYLTSLSRYPGNENASDISE